MKITYRITLLFTFLVTAILLVISLAIYYFTSIESKKIFNNRLRSRASNNAQIYSYLGDTNTAVLSRIDAGSLALLPQKSVVIYNESGKVLYRYNAERSQDIQIDTTMFADFRENEMMYFKIGHREAVGFYLSDGGKGIYTVVAAYDEDGKLRLSDLRKILLTCMVVGMIAILVAGYLFSRQLVKPITQIIHEVNDISSYNLSHRLQTGESQDELNQLASTFNELLNRLQESFNTQRRFISNASHELSTPLTSIFSQLDVTLRKDRSTAEYKQVLYSIREDVQQMHQLTRSLLEIAKTGSQGSIELKEVRIDEVLLKVISDVKNLNEEYKVEFNFEEFPEDDNSCMVFGNHELLYSAMKNIVENGCKFSPDHYSVVSLSFDKDNIVIEVKNEGDVIAEEEIEQIFQPFYRSASAGEIRGFGLGLPLSKRIISLHKGVIKVRSDLESGTHFTIVLPSIKSDVFEV